MIVHYIGYLIHRVNNVYVDLVIIKYIPIYIIFLQLTNVASIHQLVHTNLIIYVNHVLILVKLVNNLAHIVYLATQFNIEY